MVLYGVSLLGVFVAALSSMVLGFVWYGPLFGKKWMQLVGLDSKKMKDMKKGVSQSYALAFVGSLVMAYVLAYFVKSMRAATPMAGAQVGFLAWLGFVATVTLGGVLWENKPKELYLLNNAYNLVNLAVMGVIVAVL